MHATFNINGKRIKTDEMTQEQIDEVNLFQRWNHSKEKEILEQYAGQPIEKVPKEYREKIAKLREFGLGQKEKTTYEQVIEFLETHDGKIMSNSFSIDGKKITTDCMSIEQKDEVNLNQRWNNSKEKEILDQYAGQPIENVPEEYREKIAKLRQFGLGIKPSKLRQAKKQRDDAKNKNNQAKEFEGQVSEQLKKRGIAHEEQ